MSHVKRSTLNWNLDAHRQCEYIKNINPLVWIRNASLSNVTCTRLSQTGLDFEVIETRVWGGIPVGSPEKSSRRSDRPVDESKSQEGEKPRRIRVIEPFRN